MGRDFAKKGRHKPREMQSSRHWAWLLIGLAIGMLISIAAVYKLFPLVYPALTKLEPLGASSLSIEADEAEEVASSRSPQFDFYSLLPKLEVNVAKEAAVAPEKEIATASSPKTDNAYRLQLGSFRNFADADRLKAQMAMIGVQVEVETVNLAPNDTWYRVRSNTYPNRESAQAVREQLQAQAIDSLLLEDQG